MVIRNISNEKILINNQPVYPKQQIKVDDDFDLNKFKDKIKDVTILNVNYNKNKEKREQLKSTKQETVSTKKPTTQKKSIVASSINSVIESKEINDNFLSDFENLKINYLNLCEEKNIDNDIIDKIKSTSSKEDLIYVVINYVLPILN